MAKSPTELIRELSAQVEVLSDRDTNRRAELDELKTRAQQEREERRAAGEKYRDEVAQLCRELAEARQESAVLRQQFQDHFAQYQEWDKRRWGIGRGTRRRGAVAGIRVDRHPGEEVNRP